jgi:predicted permease
MSAMILCGVAWRIVRPAGLDADAARSVLTNLVFYLLLPALVASVLWQAEIGIQSFKIALVGIGCVGFGAVATWLVFRYWPLAGAKKGAAMLAIAFPNVTYLGLPLLEETFGLWARSIAIQIDLFACTPLVLTLGISIARHYGTAPANPGGAMAPSLLRNPPLWAAIGAIVLNVNNAPQPRWLDELLQKLATTSVPLMLISLGLSLRWKSWRWASLPAMLPVVVLKLILMPLFALALARLLGFTGQTLTALILETAMPSMVFGIVLCDRFRLDSSFYALTVTLTTLLSMLTLPLWYKQLEGLPPGR